ncbi:hypothetical protein E4O00_04235 [Treponema sp. OMZ 788]|uniref:hypothetical protein n=1 Tax=Treponema sp. OMZ 788 TaxID=2563664 RepID=UPI0020A442F0|nr:hypothetical protein [Treponema sp. OMZ 788]UTC65344.1 hypothetical protein E4O00_04235 [Treponema sp. OMZ 788]
MKKILIVFFCIMLISVNIFAETNDLSTGNGNGGKNKIGAWLGFPFMGLSYSHEFNDLMELDLLVGVTGLFPLSQKLNFRTGLLFTVWEPVIKGQKCPLTIGPALDVHSNNGLIYRKEGYPRGFFSAGVQVLCPVRWEINFQRAPSFNLFIEAAPSVGFTYYFKDMDNTQNALLQKWINNRMAIELIPHIGLGLRYRIPNKK